MLSCPTQLLYKFCSGGVNFREVYLLEYVGTNCGTQSVGGEMDPFSSTLC